MDWYQSLVVIIVYGVISTFLLVRTLLCLKARTASFACYLRLLSILPAAIYGGVAVSALSSRVRDWGYGAGDPVLVSEALHTVTAFSLCVWNVIACYAISRISKWKFALAWSNKRLCPGYFVVFTVDMVFLAFMIAGCAVASTYLPSQWLFSSCDSDYCRSEMTIQVMAIIHMFQVLGLAILIAPLIMVPRRIAAPIFAFAEHVQRPFRPRDKFNKEHDLEKAILVSEDEHSQLLGTLFHHDAIAATIARHLHVDDVSNVSMTSKHLRRSILCPSPADRAQRKELLCENACINGTKDECWACTKVICEVANIPTGMQHLEDESLGS
ncbi:hypothetical protein HJFPF1_06126 [Paramyrothecium foliicola]|nr:hypothetical protein HJFPF1_06126 [Paramyrothecium foliicola]